MKKPTIMLLTALLAVALAAPASGAPEGREVSKDYSMASGAFVGHGQFGSEVHWTLGAAYQSFEARSGERSVTLKVDDAFGETVMAHVHVYRNDDNKIDEEMDFCGTSKPIAVRSGTVVEVGTIMGFCDDNTPSIVTEGNITATFTR